MTSKRFLNLTLILSLLLPIAAWSGPSSVNRVAVVLPSVGNFSAMGDSIKKGIKIAIATNPKLFKSLQFDFYGDDGSMKNIALSTVQAIQSSQPVAIIGGVTSKQALAISSIAEEKKILFLAPYATSPLVTKDKRHTFTTCGSDTQLIQGLVQAISKKKRLKKGMIFYTPSDPYSQLAAEIFKRDFERSGGQIIDQISFHSQKEISAKHAKIINRLKPEFIFLPSYQTTAAGIISTLLQSGVSKKLWFFGTDAWAGGKLFFSAFDANQDFRAAAVDHWVKAPDPKNGHSIKFFELPKSLRQELSQSNSSFQNTGAALGYDSALIVATVILKKSKLQLEGHLSDVLRTIKISGLTGDLQFESKNSPTKPTYLFRFAKGQEKLIEVVQ